MKIFLKISVLFVAVTILSSLSGKIFASAEIQEFEYVVAAGSSASDANKRCLIRDGYVHKSYSSASGLSWSKVENFFSNFKNKSETLYSFVNSDYRQVEGGPLSAPQTEIYYVYNEGQVSKKKLIYSVGPKNGSISNPKLQEVVGFVKSLCTF